ncbi:sarcosine oxidase subunit alpha family protein [uncultured Ruegeria sp.]|uniref:sarcosine oxidase subunit alpha family protein n=1 Tax=uncultured Ruegeria sp. TaxID=259304 RepID=UPI00261B8DF4|nr:sarcosine oxidase subunit alpha family protein [uncultured Ruegeria sp.]
MTGESRLSGGLIDRQTPMSFTFDGKQYSGFGGDTLASALLGNGVRLMGRSFKYHRPRGPLTAGSEEPNAIVELREGARKEPNTRATTAELFDGLVAQSQNRWPSLNWDMLAINDRLSPFLAAGFYYKTFMWPKAFWEKLYEPMIRKAAGLGTLSHEPDPDCYDKGYLHCDLLVIGAGPAGLAAALTAGEAGARVILADEDFLMGGRLNAETGLLVDQAGAQWAAETVARLAAMPNVRVMPRSTVIGAFDHGIYGLVERVSDHLAEPAPGKPRQILWRVYSKRAILAAGAIERPIVFENNDRPGIMLASALRSYANRWAVTPGRSVAIFANNDDGHRTAADLHSKGVKVTLIDTRPDASGGREYEVLSGAHVTNTAGRLGLRRVEVTRSNGKTHSLTVDGLGVSGGWNPNVHLTCHQGGRPQWDAAIAAFVPGGAMPPGMIPVGAAKGVFSTHGALISGREAAVQALTDLGIAAPAPELPEAEDAPVRPMPFWHVHGAKRAWVDHQNDVTAKDVKLAHQENFVSVEHLKRYTTLGMATDQGKTSNIAGLAIMAEIAGKQIPDVGTTMFRPPYTPTAIGVLAGRARGKDFRPVRKTPSHQWAEEQGAEFVETGMWLRAQWFPQPGDTHWRQGVDREILQTRKSVGVCDCSTLGKIDVQGRDAAEYLNMVYANGFAKLPVGKTRYGLMLREDGIVMDDGTAARLAEDHFIVTTTTANADLVYRHMEFVRQTLAPQLDVQLVPITEAWAQHAVAGPNSRKLLQKIVDPDFDISNENFPFMACGEITVCDGLRARLFRISFSGELAYEIAVPARYGDALMHRLMEEGRELDVIPYGTDALSAMRMEQGHPAGNELHGRSTARNLGMERLVSKKKDSLGSVLSERPGLNEDDAMKMVGLKPVNMGDKVPPGAFLMAKGSPVDAAHSQGHVTSGCYSPHVGCHIGIAYLKSGDTRVGEVMRLVSPLTCVDHDVEVVSAHFIDPEGERLRA